MCSVCSEAGPRITIVPQIAMFSREATSTELQLVQLKTPIHDPQVPELPESDGIYFNHDNIF